jgi:hypothetical protein
MSRPVRIALWSFLAASVALVVVPAALIGNVYQQAQNRRELFKRLNATVLYEQETRATTDRLHPEVRRLVGNDVYADVVFIHANLEPDADLSPLRQFNKLRSVLIEHGISNQGLTDLARVPTLESIELKNSQVTCDGLSQLADGAQVNELRLSDVKVSGDPSMEIRFPPALQRLNIKHEKQPGTRAVCGPIGRLQSLKHLYLMGDFVDDDALASIGDATTLETLGLNKASITDDGLKHLVQLRSLAKLFIYDVPLTDAGAVHLSRLAGLDELSLEQTSIGNDGVAALSKLTQLQVLSLQGSKLDDSGVGQLGPLKRLRRLTLSDTKVTDACAGELVQHADLESLELEGTAITDATIDALSILEKLQHLSAGPNVSRAALKRFHDNHWRSFVFLSDADGNLHQIE